MHIVKAPFIDIKSNNEWPPVHLLKQTLIRVRNMSWYLVRIPGIISLWNYFSNYIPIWTPIYICDHNFCLKQLLKIIKYIWLPLIISCTLEKPFICQRICDSMPNIQQSISVGCSPKKYGLSPVITIDNTATRWNKNHGNLSFKLHSF